MYTNQQQLPGLLLFSVLKLKACKLTVGSLCQGLAVKQEGMGTHSAQAELKPHKIQDQPCTQSLSHIRVLEPGLLLNASLHTCRRSDLPTLVKTLPCLGHLNTFLFDT